tara:strand:+ start:294 stop:467 length:174 start_codon:yes stop_codon:yes gene_type:complete
MDRAESLLVYEAVIHAVAKSIEALFLSTLSEVQAEMINNKKKPKQICKFFIKISIFI